MTASRQTSIRTVAFASLIGTTIEWYDFFLYGTATALVFNKLFFPTFDPLMGTLLSLGTYSVAFVARPIGGIVIGHYGDKIGRKSMLVLTLMIMGVATFLIGLLPTYSTLGPMAPVLLVLLRIAQGFGVGGEWGGAVLMAVEHAPPGKRGFYGSWPQIGVPAGLLLSTIVYFPFSRMPEAAFLSWGWRVPFLLSILLVAVGLIIRVRILETPAFERLKETRQAARMPIVEVLRRYPKEVLLAMGARLAENGAFYLYTTFILVYAVQHVHMDRNIVLWALIVVATIELPAIPLYGALVGSHRPPSGVPVRRGVHGADGVSDLLDGGHRRRRGSCSWRSSSASFSATPRCMRRRARSSRSSSARASATAAHRWACSSPRCWRAACRRSSR